MDEITVALYMRLSREDDKAIENGFEKDESNSISNQRKLLLGFLKKKPDFADRACSDDGRGKEREDTVHHCQGFLQIWQGLY